MHNVSHILVLFSDAVVAIEKVAEHINEMQRITEQFSPVFHQLVDEFGGEFEVQQNIYEIDKIWMLRATPQNELLLFHQVTSYRLINQSLFRF